MAKTTRTYIFDRIRTRAIAFAAVLATLVASAENQPVAAASLPGIIEIGEARIIELSGGRALSWVLRRLKRLSLRMPRVQPLIDALEDLLRRIEETASDGEMSNAEIGRRIEALAAKLTEMEARLALQDEDRAEMARLRQELRHGGGNRSCCNYQELRLGRPPP